MSLLLKSKKEVVAEFAKNEKDSGSTQVQCALMTKKIEDCATLVGLGCFSSERLLWCDKWRSHFNNCMPLAKMTAEQELKRGPTACVPVMWRPGRPTGLTFMDEYCRYPAYYTTCSAKARVVWVRRFFRALNT